MIANTTAAIEKITGQLKTLNTIRKFFTLLIYSAYLVYRIVAGNGYLALNITLLALTLGYAAFFIYYASIDKKTANKKTYHIVNRVYRWSKLLLTGIGVGLNVSGFLAVAGEGLTPLNLVFAVLIKCHTAYTGRCASHGTYGALVEADGTTVAVGDDDLLIAVCKQNVDNLVTLIEVDSIDTVLTRT